MPAVPSTGKTIHDVGRIFKMPSACTCGIDLGAKRYPAFAHNGAGTGDNQDQTTLHTSESLSTEPSCYK